jgi:arginyl-tRNA synthetase
MNFFENIKKEIIILIDKIAKEKNTDFPQDLVEKITVESCKEKSHGEIAINAAMILAKFFKINPRVLADEIQKKLIKNQDIAKIEIAGAGFINLTMKKTFWQKTLLPILQNDKVKLSQVENPLKINLEYASPNPTGPMHIGHARGAVFGNVLANLLQKVGHEVVKEYYINDAGTQISKLISSVYFRYQELFNIKQGGFPKDYYPGDYIIDIAQKVKENFGEELLNQKPKEYIGKIRELVLDEIMQVIIADLASMSIKHDVLFSEKDNLHKTDEVAKTLALIANKGLIYQGKIAPPKGMKAKEENQEDQTIFKSTQFGDDMDRVLKKADGSFTYFAADIAYAKNKIERGFDILIMPLGFDHAGYVKRLSAAVKVLSDDKVKLRVILCQMVKFIKNGQPLKMSKREGNFITVKDVIDEVGADVVKFMMLSRKNDIPFSFDLAKAIEQSKDNPVFYIHYAHTRCKSVLRNLAENHPKLYSKIEKGEIELEVLLNLNHELELDLIKKIALYPKVIDLAAQNFEPHRIAFYLQELVAIFHSLWNEGMRDHSLKFLTDDEKLTTARIYLLQSLIKIISSAFDMFDIEAMERML